jgi:hypothetical protein
MGCPVVGSMPSKISNSVSSGRIVATSSSSPIKPRSVHCRAAIVVMSLVHDAIAMMESILKGSFLPSSRDLKPNALAYLKSPGFEKRD